MYDPVMLKPARLRQLFVDRAWYWHRVVTGVVLLIVGTIVARRAFNEWGADLGQLYMSAWLLREGKNVYDFTIQHDAYMRYIGTIPTWGHFYPPASAVALLPATLVPYPLARELWFIANVLVMLYGLWRFMQSFVPTWDRSLRVLVLGIVMMAACTRWSFKVAQAAPMILGLFGLFMVELKHDRQWAAFAMAAFVGAVKATFAMPFLLLALAQRRFKLVFALGLTWVALNVGGLYRMGGPSIIADYRANMAEFERPDQLNYPDPRGYNSLARTDWPYVLNAIDPNFSRNNMIGHLLTLAALAWLTKEVLGARGTPLRDDESALALTGPLAALSMLSVYHHHYDIGIMLLPLIAYVGRPEFRRIPATWWYVIPVGLYAGIYPYEKFAKLLERIMGPSYVLIARPLACVVCVLALAASFSVLHAILQGPEVKEKETETVKQT
jgi:hypothetical protein